MSPPEQLARVEIDRLLVAAGWAVHDCKAADIHAASGVAIREFVLTATSRSSLLDNQLYHQR